jgi:death-on-curing protein
MLIEFNEELINIIHNYVVTRLTANEGIVYSGTVSGCIRKVFTAIYGEKKYGSLHEKAGAILYSLVNGHSFTDGNKRTGLLTTCLFLYYNGLYLKVPPDCAKYLECMADAQNPNAPTEPDAIEWVKKYAEKSLFSRATNFIYSLGYRTLGKDYLAQTTKTILERDVIPYLDQKKLIDYELLKMRREKWKKRSSNSNSG